MSLPVIILIIVAMISLAGYVAYLFVTRSPMSRTGYLVCCVVSTILAMTFIGWGLKYVIYEISAWWVIPWGALMFFLGWLIERHEHKQGTLPPPRTAFERWYSKWLLPKAPTEAPHTQDNAASRNRPDQPE